MINKDELLEIRRTIHKNPELSGEEIQTSRYIRKKLDEYAIPYTEIADNATMAIIKGKSGGKTVLLRADIDALPIDEKNDLPYKSQKSGVMHACGHDIHTACVLYAGKVLNEMKDNFCGNVKLVFQPSEETDGGAEKMIDWGVMENPKVDGAFALHVEPLEKCGFIQIKDDAIMASPDDFEIEITGRGGHGAVPHECIDPITLASMIVLQYNTVAAKYFSAQVPCVVTVCSISGGYCPNVIPDTVTMLGTARSLDEDTRERLAEILEKIAVDICENADAKCRFVFNKRFPPTINDHNMNVIVENAAAKIPGIKGITHLKYSSMCGDDFAYFARKVPSAYFKLGIGNDICKSPIHSAEFMADEDALPIGVSILVQSTLDFLKE